MKKTNKQDESQTTKLRGRKRIWFSVGIIVIIYVVFLFVPFISSYAKYPLYVIKCGRQPIVANIGKSYTVPGTDTYSVTGLDEAFFCTEEDARAAGYRRYGT